MFTRKRFIAPTLTGDWAKDGPVLVKAMSDYWLSLEGKGATAITQVAKWTPVLTFATPGNLAVTYTTQVAEIVVFEDQIFANFRIVTSAFTHTTAAGNVQITGLPYTANADTGFVWDGSCVWGGITMPGGRTQCNVGIAAGTNILLVTASGSAVAPVNITAADMPTGGNVVLRGNVRLRA